MSGARPKAAPRSFQSDGHVALFIFARRSILLGLLPRVGAPRRAARDHGVPARSLLAYYSSQRPTDDHGVQPVVLVVFEDEIAQAHFLRVAKAEMARTGVSLPLFVSHRELLEREGPLGMAWQGVGDAELGYAFRAA